MKEGGEIRISVYSQIYYQSKSLLRIAYNITAYTEQCKYRRRVLKPWEHFLLILDTLFDQQMKSRLRNLCRVTKLLHFIDSKTRIFPLYSSRNYYGFLESMVSDSSFQPSSTCDVIVVACACMHIQRTSIAMGSVGISSLERNPGDRSGALLSMLWMAQRLCCMERHGPRWFRVRT